jgi:hypothetical protein
MSRVRDTEPGVELVKILIDGLLVCLDKGLAMLIELLARRVLRLFKA